MFKGKKQIYLIGGLGNNLFQIDYGLRHGDAKDVVFVKTLIAKRFYSKLFGWTFHEPSLLRLKLNHEIQLVERSPLLVILDLILLFFAKNFKYEIFGVSWNSSKLTRINFGYYQEEEYKHPFVLKIRGDKKIYDAVVHLRLGDSPTLKEDLEYQLNEINKLRLSFVQVVTNNRKHARILMQDLSLGYEFIGGDVLDDLEILMSSRILIAPRSTFSLAAALMSVNLELLVIDEMFWRTKGRPVNYKVKFY